MINSGMIWKLLIFLIFIFINFSIFKISDVEFSIGYILVYLLPFFLFEKFKLSKIFLLCYSVFLFSDIFRIFFIQTFPFTMATTLKIHLQIFVLIVFIGLFFRSDLKKSVIIYLSSTLKFISAILLLSIVIQYISFYFLDNSLYNFFGKFQWMYPLTLSKFRPKSFYLEPSYLALVLNSLLLSDFLINTETKIITRYRVALIIFTFLSGSLFGIMVCIFLIGIMFFLKKKIRIFEVLLILLFVLIVISFNFLNRLSEIGTENTSGYERVLLPVLVIFYMIFDFKLYFGIPFGYDFLLMESLRKTLFFNYPTLQNSFFLLIVYLGVVFVPFSIYYLKKIKNGSLEEKVLLLTIPLLLFNSGGLYTFYYGFFVYLIPILALRVGYEKNKSSTY